MLVIVNSRQAEVERNAGARHQPLGPADGVRCVAGHDAAGLQVPVAADRADRGAGQVIVMMIVVLIMITIMTMIMMSRAESPIVNGYFCLATETHDNDGLPHTLEHLVFLGSEDYPYKEVLDLLANR